MNTGKITKWVTIIIIVALSNTVVEAQTRLTSPAETRFTSFKIHSNQKKVFIDWTTDKKIATNYFEIERSSDGTNFETIALIMGPDPKQTKGDCYECIDKPGSTTKKYYYRLKHISTSGEIELSEAKLFTVNNKT